MSRDKIRSTGPSSNITIPFFIILYSSINVVLDVGAGDFVSVRPKTDYAMSNALDEGKSEDGK